MKYISGPKNGIWVAVNEEQATQHDIRTLYYRTKSVQTWFFDLDDNHADSPAKKLALGRVGTSMFSPRFISWALTQGAPAKLIKDKEPNAWKKYVNEFLRSDEALAQVSKLYNKETAQESLYGGVQDFARLVSHAPRFYVTRNIEPVAQAYTLALGIEGFFHEADRKERVVEGYLSKNPHIKIIGIDGDSQEDAAMIKVAKSLKREVVSFYSMKHPKDPENIHFDYFVSKDRTGLVNLLK